ncbi:Uncharacterised protein [uncultured Bacteroides sp.]|mgnify:CR=1 FL=1|jgi:hypothetical protein|nr:Uncharacterised protein [uncultured Bacteroides sp.]
MPNLSNRILTNLLSYNLFNNHKGPSLIKHKFKLFGIRFNNYIANYASFPYGTHHLKNQPVMFSYSFSKNVFEY